MSDIFISYSRHDTETARLLARALEKFGWTVWSDAQIKAGQSFSHTIEAALTASRCVIVLWSSDSIASQWVRAEASLAAERNNLISVLIESVTVPLLFRHFHCEDLVGWRGNADALRFVSLVGALANRIGLHAEASEQAALQPTTGFRKSILGARRALNEGKLILVGFGGVGKTTLVNRLVLDRTFNKDESKTDGIQISDWWMSQAGRQRAASTAGGKQATGLKGLLKRLSKAQAVSADPDSICIHVWDFGGQEIMHATHQFFLTTRALYLLVLGGRQGREDTDAEYWLDMIATFGADSPVIVVLNKIKQLPFDVNRRALQAKHPNVCAFVETDCEDDTGLDALANLVRREIGRMPHLRDTFPANWFTVKDRLTSMAEDFVSFDEFRKMCESAGEYDLQSQDTLASFLHTLGVALNFREDPRLRDLHVLKPKWMTEGIYTILNNKALALGRGELTLTQLSKILDPHRYPRHRHPFLFDLMQSSSCASAFRKMRVDSLCRNCWTSRSLHQSRGKIPTP
jgi:GTPase SAR1 family protein